MYFAFQLRRPAWIGCIGTWAAGVVMITASELYAASISNTELIGISWGEGAYRINAQTGAVVQLADENETGRSFNAMARDSSGRFVASRGTPTNDLYLIDPATGSSQLLVDITDPNFETIRGLAFGLDDTLYAIERPFSSGDANSLYRIDVNSGSVTFIGDTGMVGLQSLAMSPSGIMYSFGINGVGLGLVTIDLTTGIGTDPFPLDDDQLANIQSLAFSGDGTLYGIGQLGIYTIEIPTGVVNQVAEFQSTLTDIRGAEFVVVPEPNSLVLGLVGILGALLLWKRSRTLR